MIPNFWMTPEYVKFAELEWMEANHGLCGWVDPSSDQVEWVFPPMAHGSFFINSPIWAGFPDNPGEDGAVLDRQYFYDPDNFEDLHGKEWKTYRKNIRKYPSRVKGNLWYRRLKQNEQQEAISELLANWAEGKEIQDPEVMVRFCLMGQTRWGLFLDDQLVGINVGDHNWIHGIYRYCLDDGTPFLNEYLRHCFYTSFWAQGFCYINDGGDLDNPELARFKQKLNPTHVATVYSHGQGENNANQEWSNGN